MPAVSVQITRYVDDHFPGFVECVLVDAFGTTHTFVEKAPVVSSESLSAASTYPCNGEIECEVCREWQDAAGLAFSIVRIEIRWRVESDFSRPARESRLGVTFQPKESSSGEIEFTVSSSQLRHTGACA
jgi:hypothetical protein